MTRPRPTHLSDCDTITKSGTGRNGSPPKCTCKMARKARELKKKQRATASKGQTASIGDGAASIGDGCYRRLPLRTGY